jgi:exonuclease SbcD
MKTIILGDIHLGKGLSIGKPGIGNSLNSRIQDQIRLLDWTLQTAIENNVFSIISTGDVFEDSKPHPSLITIFIDWLQRCVANNISVHILMGNHDLLRSGNYVQSALDVIAKADIENIYVYKNIDTAHFDGVSFTFVPFKDRRGMECDTHEAAFKLLRNNLSYEVASIPNLNSKVLVGHLALDGAIPVGDEFDDVATELHCPSDIFNGYDYVFMGHIHKPQVVNNNPYLAHVGSMDISDFGFGELNEPKIIVLFNSDEEIKFTNIVIPTRPLIKISIDVPEGSSTTKYLKEILIEENNKTSFKDAIIKLEVKLYGREAESTDRDIIEELIYSYGAHHISNFSETRSIAVVPIKKLGVVNNTMDVTTAINLYSDHIQFNSQEEKEDFLNEASLVYNLFLGAKN